MEEYETLIEILDQSCINPYFRTGKKPSRCLAALNWTLFLLSLFSSGRVHLPTPQAHPFPPSFLFPSFFLSNELGHKKTQSHFWVTCKVWRGFIVSWYFMNMGIIIHLWIVDKFSKLFSGTVFKLRADLHTYTTEYLLYTLQPVLNMYISGGLLSPQIFSGQHLCVGSWIPHGCVLSI